VWVNKTGKVYHCHGDKWYGKTKEGSIYPKATLRLRVSSPITAKPATNAMPLGSM